MAHPLFARLDQQLVLVKQELAQAEASEALFRRLKKRGGSLYHEWSHNAAVADGVHAIYTGIESIMEAIANEIDDYAPRGDASHADLVDSLSVAVKDVRPAVLRPATRELMHEVRRFRHVVRHKYALQLRRTDIARNFAAVRKLLPAFEHDYRAFAQSMSEEDRSHAGGQARNGKGPRRKPR